MIAAACPYECLYACPCGNGGAEREDGNKYEQIANGATPGSVAARATASSDKRNVARVVVKESVGRGDRGLLHADGRDASPPHAQPYEPKHSQGGDTSKHRPRCSNPRAQAYTVRSIHRTYSLPTGHDLRAWIQPNNTAPRASRLGLRCRTTCAPAGRACPQLVVHGGSAQRTIAAVRRLVIEFHGQEAQGTGGGAARIQADAMTGSGRRDAQEEGGTSRPCRGPRSSRSAFGALRQQKQRAALAAQEVARATTRSRGACARPTREPSPAYSRTTSSYVEEDNVNLICVRVFEELETSRSRVVASFPRRDPGTHGYLRRGGAASGVQEALQAQHGPAGADSSNLSAAARRGNAQVEEEGNLVCARDSDGVAPSRMESALVASGSSAGGPGSSSRGPAAVTAAASAARRASRFSHRRAATSSTSRCRGWQGPAT